MKTLLLIVLLFMSACAYDPYFTWQNECDFYHKCDTVEMPKIVVSDVSPVNADGDRILGQYVKATHTVYLFNGHDADTIEHEFAHALGDNLGEK